jgi:predicted nuclease of predicted toxin-antitoxin system
VKVKLDENLGRRSAERFRAAGHNVATVHEQGLSAASDAELIAACRSERRCLVSLDMDFANPLLFKPSQYAGIAVLRLPSKPSADDLVTLVDLVAAELTVAQVEGRLWVVEPGRIRQYQPEEE